MEKSGNHPKNKGRITSPITTTRKKNLWTTLITAILILRFHDIKTLAPRGVNNS
ncbi:hypothetical protein GQR42_00360 [Microcystis aeruginosa FD4]|uniref:Uncharacterized protein n=1 Tax=Microcystis aeruginosa FD4 TaxID=2686288 RepID=A0A857CYR0_MICAE|nr:hypothetical protein GQR42_00360 [Microcystis aeruginosa FD4]